MKHFTRVIGAAALLAGSMGAQANPLALIGADPTEIKSNFDSMTGTMASMFTYKSVSPAASAAGGLLPVGFDVGAEVSMTELPAGSAMTDLLPSFMQGSAMVPFPKLHAHLGIDVPFIPFVPAVDLGYSWMSAGDLLSYMGGEVKVNIAGGNMLLPAIAVRGTMSNFAFGYQGVDVAKLSSFGTELTVSKGFGIGIKITPYAGVGYHWYKASSDMTMDYLAGLSGLGAAELAAYQAVYPNGGDKIVADVTGGAGKWFIGAALKLFLFNIGYEMDSTGGNITQTGKISFVF